MSLPITEWINQYLYPALFLSIDRAFPELYFKRNGNDWWSILKLDRSAPKKPRPDKAKITQTHPHRILEQGGPTIGLIDYVMERDSVNFIKAAETLADIVRLKLPKGSHMDEKKYQKSQEKSNLLNDANSYFTSCLTTTTEANETRNYLLNSRGYNLDTITDMKLGYIPNQEGLIQHLQERKYSKDVINETLKLNKAIGYTHRLTIPYISWGTIRGFKFRNINHNDGEKYPKYLNTSGEGLRHAFFNIVKPKKDKGIIIVEGELDALHATTQGVPNVVATCGNSILPQQIKDAIEMGVNSFTICFDRVPNEEEETDKKIFSAIQKIREERGNRVHVYIMTLPNLREGKIDPDKLIKDEGVETFKKCISSRLTMGAYLGTKMLKEYRSKVNDKGEIDYKERDLLKDQVVITRSRLIAQDRVDFNERLIKPLESHGLTEEILADLEEDYRTVQEETKRNQKLDKLLNEVKQEEDKGEAIKRLKEGLKEIDTITGKGLVPLPMSFATLLDEIKSVPQACLTGYKSLDKFVGFTPGTITLIAGRPSHGKTTFMYNLLLNMSEIDQGKGNKFLYFHYEEPNTNIVVKFLNRLTDTDLKEYFKWYPDLAKPTNYEFLKAYIRNQREDIPEVEDGKKHLQELIDSQVIQLIDTRPTVEELSKIIAYISKRDKIRAVFIDYIQRMTTTDKKGNIREETNIISKTLVDIASNNNIPLIVGCQFNRASVSVGAKRPTLEGLKESGNLEEDANTVLSVYDESRESEENDNGDSYNNTRKVDLEIKTLKNREGEVNKKTLLLFDKLTGAITDPIGTKSDYHPFKENRFVI